MWYQDLLQEIRDFCKRLGIEVKSVSEVNITSKGNEKAKASVDSAGVVKINLHNLSPDEKKDFRKFIHAAHEKKALLVETKAESRLEIIEQSEKYASKTDIINLLTGVVSPADLAAIRMSLYLRVQHEKGEKRSVSILKGQICERFGDRGKNISNLCTAGYFETFIIPLYKECKENNTLTNDDFRRIFNVIIDESAFSIFVNKRMSKEDVINKIKEQITKNSKYGIDYLAVHGIGELNVKNISSALLELESAGELTIGTLDKSTGNIIRATCTYKLHRPSTH